MPSYIGIEWLAQWQHHVAQYLCRQWIQLEWGRIPSDTTSMYHQQTNACLQMWLFSRKRHRIQATGNVKKKVEENQPQFQ